MQLTPCHLLVGPVSGREVGGSGVGLDTAETERSCDGTDQLITPGFCARFLLPQTKSGQLVPEHV